MGILKALLTVEVEPEDESAASPEEISKQKLEAALDRMIAERSQGSSPVGPCAMSARGEPRIGDGAMARGTPEGQGPKAGESRNPGLTAPRIGGFGRRTQRPA